MIILRLKTGNISKSIKLRVFFITFSIVILFIFSGCSAERKLSKTFVKSNNIGPALIFMPKVVYKYNLKTDILDSVKYSENEKDSILWFSSDFIQNIYDSVFLLNYQKGFIYELQQYGIKTYTSDSIDAFFNNDSNGFVVNVAQIELEEQYYPFVDSEDEEGITYTHKQQLNALDVSSWFEIRMVNNPEKVKMLFAENLLTDNFQGFFEQNPFTGQMQYFYHLDSLTVKDIYHDAYNLGRTYASYTFDYLLNKYLDSHLPPDMRSKHFLHYDIYRKIFYPAENDRFETISH